MVHQKYRFYATIKVIQTFFPIMKKVTKPTKSAKDLRLSIILDKLTDLGWEYTCNCMTRSGMQTYDELMQLSLIHI